SGRRRRPRSSRGTGASPACSRRATRATPASPRRSGVGSPRRPATSRSRRSSCRWRATPRSARSVTRCRPARPTPTRSPTSPSAGTSAPRSSGSWTRSAADRRSAVDRTVGSGRVVAGHGTNTRHAPPYPRRSCHTPRPPVVLSVRAPDARTRLATEGPGPLTPSPATAPTPAAAAPPARVTGRALARDALPAGGPTAGEAVAPHSTLVTHDPDVAVLAATEADVAEAVRFAAARGLRVRAHATGHGAASDVSDGLVL